MNKSVRCAVLGLGRAGYRHAENLATSVRGCELVCVADPIVNLAEKAASELGIRKFTGNPDEVMEDDSIEAVIIATSTPSHAELVKKAAANGKHVFVEKPLTARLEEADELIQVIEDTSVACQVGFMRRFDPAFAEAKRRIDAGDIGKPLYFKSVSRDPGSPPAEFIKHSGGIFVDMAIHDFDMARFLMNAEVTSVISHGQILAHEFMRPLGDVDQSLTYLTFDSGAAGDVEAGRNAFYGYDIRGEVIGTEGSIVIGSLKYHDVHIQTSKGSLHDITPSFPLRFNDAFRLELIHFMDCVRNGVKPSVSAKDGKAALEIAWSAQASFETGKRVEIR